MKTQGRLDVRPLFQWSKCLAFLLAFTLIGCNRKENATATPMNIEETIRTYRNSPVRESIGPIAKCLAIQSVFVGTEGVASTEAGRLTSKIRLKAGADNRGHLWAYAYTSRAEFDKAFPEGGAFAEMKISAVLKIVEADERFSGIYLNSASDASYPILRELFERVK